MFELFVPKSMLIVMWAIYKNTTDHTEKDLDLTDTQFYETIPTSIIQYCSPYIVAIGRRHIDNHRTLTLIYL
jgi:hypothetical protein